MEGGGDAMTPSTAERPLMSVEDFEDFSEPKDGQYQQSPSYPWGAIVELPAPVSITLDTEELKDYAD
jgi:hypothetical protein